MEQAHIFSFRTCSRIESGREISDKSRLLVAMALLFVLALAVFDTALNFVPGTSDDLELLTSVAHTTQPLKYLVGDFGMGPYGTGNYGQYRPLHSLSLWLVYRSFGLSFFPNQFINFALHFINAVLVLVLIWRVQRDLALSFLGASLFLISVHTVSPATWVSDRPNLLVGFAFLLLLHHAVSVRNKGGSLRIPTVLGLCLIALLSKESGLIVPVMAISISLRIAEQTRWQRIRSSAVWAGVILTYFAGRIMMFGTNAFSYSTYGYLFGLRRYDLASDLPGHLRLLATADNVLKNIVELFLPVFTDGGGFSFKFDSARIALIVLLGALAMACLVALTTKAKLTALQIDCLCAVILNAAIHNAIFRYRDLYTAQIAVSVLVACSAALSEPRRRRIAFAAAFVVLLVSVTRVENFIQANYVARYIELNRYSLARDLQSFHGKRVDRHIAQQLVDGYRDRNWSRDDAQ
jgi:hypothetical protein